MARFWRIKEYRVELAVGAFQSDHDVAHILKMNL